MKNEQRGVGLAWWAAATIFVSAFLLFQVQPVISKKILPWFGGSPAVWTTCMLFFQVLLLGGYAYAHWLTHAFRPRMQGIIHAALLVVAICTLPITPSNWWKPDDGYRPALRILVLLAAEVGIPYFLLASTGPLVQAWFSLAYPGRSPYRLYALSNIGSLAALLSYPFWFETTFTVDRQGNLWSLVFVVFGILCGGLALVIWRLAEQFDLEAQRAAGLPPEPPAPSRWRLWLGGALAAMLVLEILAIVGGKFQSYVLLASGIAIAAVVALLWRSLATLDSRPVQSAESTNAAPEPMMRAAWLALAALPSMAFLAITNHLCQDIAVVPFMWVAPLSLYLLSFIFCFDSPYWYSRKLFGVLGVLLIGLLALVQQSSDIDAKLLSWKSPLTVSGIIDPIFTAVDKVTAPIGEWIENILRNEWAVELPLNLKLDVTTSSFEDSVYAQSITLLTILFVICMLCHGELVRFKPAPKYLTMFYLMISAGGALGGLFVAIICPLAFTTDFEFPLSIICGFAVAWVALANDGRYSWLAGREVLQWSAAFAVVGSLILVARGQVEGPDENVLAQTRNFYGRLKVKLFNAPEKPEDPPNESTGRALYHGRILHGYQYLSPERVDEATTYYESGTGAGVSVENYDRLPGQGLRVAVIGLGTGTMAAHAQRGDVYRFYDINPDVIRISDKWFSFRSRAEKRGAKIDTILGDARIQMERELREEQPQAYDVIVLDAFSGDAIPAHLLTAEAIEIYDQHLRRDEQGNVLGILAVHISNRYLDLEPVVFALARKYKYDTLSVHFDEGPDSGDTGADWVLLTRNAEFLAKPNVLLAGEPLVLAEGTSEVLWTDQSSNLFEILK